MKINMSEYEFKVIDVLNLTEQVALVEIESGMRFYYKHKYNDDLLKTLNRGDLVSMDSSNTRLVKRGVK